MFNGFTFKSAWESRTYEYGPEGRLYQIFNENASVGEIKAKEVSNFNELYSACVDAANTMNRRYNFAYERYSVVFIMYSGRKPGYAVHDYENNEYLNFTETATVCGLYNATKRAMLENYLWKHSK